MSNFDLSANIAPLLTLISALTAAIVSIINAINARNRAQVQHERLNAQDVVLTEIKAHTNGALDALKAESDAAQQRADALQNLLKDMTSARRKRLTDLGIATNEASDSIDRLDINKKIDAINTKVDDDKAEKVTRDKSISLQKEIALNTSETVKVLKDNKVVE